MSFAPGVSQKMADCVILPQASALSWRWHSCIRLILARNPSKRIGPLAPARQRGRQRSPHVPLRRQLERESLAASVGDVRERSHHHGRQLVGESRRHQSDGTLASAPPPYIWGGQLSTGMPRSPIFVTLWGLYTWPGEERKGSLLQSPLAKSLANS